MEKNKIILVTGGAGYVGSLLVPRLMAEGYKVKVLDLYIYGDTHFKDLSGHPNLIEIKGDIRDRSILANAVSGCDAVIHLACISNDPSFELNPALSRTINYDAFEPLVMISRKKGVKRFIFASSSSVYGVSDSPQVTEEHPLFPITDYNKYKALCETVLFKYQSDQFTTVAVRPATICGYAPRQRFDLTVNILTNHAINNGKITVFGGTQRRPNLHIRDMVDLYVTLLTENPNLISGQAFNVGYQNHTVARLAEMVRSVIQDNVPGRKKMEIQTTPSDDIRSYHISSDKIRVLLGFEPKHTIENAVKELCSAFESGRFTDTMTNPVYYNIKRMQQIDLA